MLWFCCASPIPTPRSTEQGRAPTLERRLLVNEVGLRPESRHATLAVSVNGEIAFTSGFNEGDNLVTIVDSTGHLIATFGPQGDGPGEFSAPQVLAIDDSVVTVFDQNHHRITVATYSGDVVRERTINPAIFVQRIIADTIFGAVHSYRGRRIEGATLYSWPLGDRRESQMTGWVQDAYGAVISGYGDYGLAERVGMMAPPVLGPGQGLLAVADPYFGRISVSDMRGEELYRVALADEPRVRSQQEVDESLETSRPREWVGPGGEQRVLPSMDRETLETRWLTRIGGDGLWFDENNRLWVVQEGYPTKVNVFSSSGVELLGLEIECEVDGRRIALNGAWFALLCVNDVAVDREVDMRLFKIVEPTG